MMKYFKRTNTVGALNRGHNATAVFSGEDRVVCPPQPKFDMTKPPPYRLGVFPSKKRPIRIVGFGRFGLYYGANCMLFFSLNDRIYSSLVLWRFSLTATVKVTKKMRKKWAVCGEVK